MTLVNVDFSNRALPLGYGEQVALSIAYEGVIYEAFWLMTQQNFTHPWHWSFYLVHKMSRWSYISSII